MKTNKKQKLFLLDTSILLVDTASFLKFDSHDVVITLDVIAELDKIKKYDDSVGLSAREVTRLLDEHFSPKMFENEGVSMGMGKGNLFLYSLKELNLEVKRSLKDDTVDHRIISAALNLKQKKGQTKEVVLVSNDTNLRFKASFFGLVVQPYKNDRIEDISFLYKGVSIVDESKNNDNIMASLYSDKKITKEEIEKTLKKIFQKNEFIIFKAQDRQVISILKESGLSIVNKKNIYGRVEPKNAGQVMAMDMLLDKDIHLATLCGPAGTGKTLLAIGAAISQANDYNQIFIARPIVAMSNKDLGYLPGDVQSKIAPYMQPLFDNIKFIKQANGGGDKKKSSKIDDLIEDGKLVIEPLAYIRGRTLPNTLFIVDEAQNLTPNEIKTIITRAGEGSKFIFTGDIYQIDHPYLDSYSNGLTYLIEKAKDYEKAAHIYLDKGERSPLSDWGAKTL